MYVSPDGRFYQVRNPNYSPFYSLRFKPAAAGLADGQTEIFQYVLPPQASADYIHVTVWLASGTHV